MTETIAELPDLDLDDDDDDDDSDETDAEREAREDTATELDELSREFVSQLIDKLLVFTDELTGYPLYKYQIPVARRIFESLIINDGARITCLMSRQSGKSETIANVVATAMLLLPRLAKVHSDLLGKFSKGLWVGAFAPVDDQADNLFGRIVSRLSSEKAEQIMADPEINERLVGKGKLVGLKNCGSYVRKTTCHPRATIEGRSYHLILIDEAQGADDVKVNKSVAPMGAAYNATMVMTGTPTYEVNVFYAAIQENKRTENRRGGVQDHFQVDWREAVKANANYGKYVRKQMLLLGEDSDEFKLSYRCLWLLEKGMFTTSEILDDLGDRTMQSVVHAWHHTPVVVGIDCGRKQDKTIVTVVWVGWDRPDAVGIYQHRILNWLDLSGDSWELQYQRITEFLSNYAVWKVGIDIGGLGDTVAERLKILNPHIDFVELGSGDVEQSARWKYLKQLLERGSIAWPAGAKVRKLKMWKRFRTEMEQLHLKFRGPYVLAEAPTTKDAHDDYPDSLAMACILTKDTAEDNTVEQSENVFYKRSR